MAAAGRASLVMLALLMAVVVQLAQAAPAPAAAASLRSGDDAWEEQRVLHPTCDHDQFMDFMRLSCQYHRRRREVRGAATAEAETEAAVEAVTRTEPKAEEAAVEDGRVARVERSPSPSPEADLFAKCCERTCDVEDFVGVCP